MNANFVSTLRKGTLEQRRAAIVAHTGVVLAQLEKIVAQPITIREKVVLLSKELFTGAAKRMDDLSAAQVISAGTIGAFLHPELDARDAYNATYSEVYQRFLKQAKSKSESCGEEISPFMVLRDISLASSGVPYLQRIVSARSTWRDNVAYSQTDTRKGIRLPLVGQSEAFLFGVATMCFTFNEGSRIVPKKSASGIEKNETREHRRQCTVVTPSYNGNRQWYDKTVWPLLRNTFNMSPNDKPAEFIHSRAIYEFFRHALAYSSTVEERSLLSFETIQPEVLNDSISDLNHAYFAGIISRQLKIDESRKKLSGELLAYRNRGLALQINSLAQKLSFSPEYDAKTGKLLFDHNGILQLASSSHHFNIHAGNKHFANKGYLFNTAQQAHVAKYLE